MKSKKEIEQVLKNLPPEGSRYYSMTYEQGIDEALRWVLEELEDVDFELELIHRDEINVAYIIRLLIKLKANQKKDAEQIEKEIRRLEDTNEIL